MASWRLPASLHSIFVELNATWPNRSHTDDGTIGDRKHCPGSSDHCPDANGWIHAIDIEKDGIDLDYVVGKLSNPDNVVRYINWNRFQYHVRNDFRPMPLGGTDPHTGHAHVSIEHTPYARNFAGPWGIFPQFAIPAIVLPDPTTIPDTDWDHSAFVHDLANEFYATGNILAGYSNAFAQLRN